MITAGTVVGKIVGLIADKTASRVASLALDKRRKACRALTKLYFCVSALDEACGDILRTFEDFRSDGTAFGLINALNNHMHEVAHASNMLIDLGYELEPGLQIIDPAVAATCHTLYRGKFDFLSFLSDSVAWDRTGDKPIMTIKAPTGRMDAANLEAAYQEARVALGAGEKTYWPESALDDFRDAFDSISVRWGDDHTAEVVSDMLISQKAALAEAREGLRSLLAEKFSVHEILFQADSHPYR